MDLLLNKINLPANQLSKPIGVLVVEDNKLHQKITKLLLEALGCYVDIAQNGEEALNIYSVGYDLLLLDVDLPGINGIEVCREIKRRIHPSPYIAALTAYTEAKEECLAAGIDEFIPKPLMIKTLKQLIQIVTQRLKKYPTNSLNSPGFYEAVSSE